MPRILILIFLALLAVTAAGCGSKPTSSGVAQLPSATTTTSSSSSSSSSSDSPTSKEDDIYKFSSCMRSHGVPKFPDPTRSSGGGMNLNISPGSGLNPNTPQFKAAQKSCEKLLPNGGKPDAAMQAKAQAQMLKFSACMRSHGLPNFPDPKFSGGGAKLTLDGKGGGLNPNSPVFQAAQKACESVLPGGKGGPKTSSSGTGTGPTSGNGPTTQMSIAP
jgi:hypothetical protein